VYSTQHVINPVYIINFPTKRHWKGASKIEDITLGLVDLKKVISANNIKSIAIPALGAGLGGLDWQTVKHEILLAFNEICDLKVTVFEPFKAPDRSS
jgi:O-acetyl-ADP-ribose deacetylase (regulator of RNase III)